MRGLNNFQAIGNLGKDPEVRHAQSGTAVANFSLAINERRKFSEGWRETTEWLNCVAFGSVAEVCSKYLSKGSPVYLRGRIQTRKWEDREGKTRYTTEMVVDDIRFLGEAKEHGERSDANRMQSRPDPGEPREFDPADDVPF